MKYDWRSGNTTYFEDRRFEGTVNFGGRVKPHFVYVEATSCKSIQIPLVISTF